MIFGVLDQSAQFSILPNDIHSGKRVDDGMLMQIHMSRKCLQTYMFEGKGDILYCLLLEPLQVTTIVTKPISFKFSPFANTELYSEFGFLIHHIE
jgi:hypothetical protein